MARLLVVMGEIAQGVEAIAKVKAPSLTLTGWLALVLARLLETWARWTGGEQRHLGN